MAGRGVVGRRLNHFERVVEESDGSCACTHSGGEIRSRRFSVRRSRVIGGGVGCLKTKRRMRREREIERERKLGREVTERGHTNLEVGVGGKASRKGLDESPRRRE